jgi:two-component system response regulator AgrA
MIPIYVCEDEPQQLRILKKVITQIIKKEKLEGLKLECATNSPHEILGKVNAGDASLYFLDIELGENTMSGLDLAAKIRVLNPSARIIMVTAYNFALETYQMKIGVQDYIMKRSISDVEEKIKECLIDASISLQKIVIDNRTYITIQKNKIAINEIIYIEIAADMPRKLAIQKTDRTMRLVGTLKDIECQATDILLYCNKSCLVNINHVKEIDMDTNEVIMTNGIKIPVSCRYTRKINKEVTKAKCIQV